MSIGVNTSTLDRPRTADLVAGALRSNQIGEFNAASSYAAALLPLLESLNWRGNMRDVAETLPHFANSLDLTDLRNTLVALGFESEGQKLSLRHVDRRLLPVLFVRDDADQALVVTAIDDESFLVIDRGERRRIPLEEANIGGTAYFFTQIDSGSAASSDAHLTWFRAAILRFKHSLRRLLWMTLFINLMSAAVPLFVMTVYDKVIGAKSVHTLPFLIGGIIVVLVSDVGIRHYRSQLLGAVAGRLDYLMGISSIGQILNLPSSFTERSTVNAQLARIKQFEAVREFFTGPLANTALDLPFSVFFLAIIAIIAGPIAFIPLVMLGLMLLFGHFWVPRSRELSTEASVAATEKQNFLAETVSNLSSIKASAAEETWRHRYRLLSSNLISCQHQVAERSSILQSMTQGLMSLSSIAVVSLGAYLVIAGNLTIGALIATMALVWRVLSPFQSGFMAYTRFEDIKKSVQQINQLMRLPVERTGQTTSLLHREYAGAITFNRVSFKYSSETDPALVGVSMKIDAGEFIGVIGTNGSGKSTILKLITGLYYPQGGTISIDGLDVRQLDPIELRRQISYVPQAAQLFYGTIAQNLRLADPTASDDQLRKATDMIGALPIIESMPDGFETRLSDGVVENLPAGFVQRLNIARAFVRPSNIVLMDEPATALDFSGDQALVKLLSDIKGKKTVVMISHRPSHIRLADKVFVLNQGFVEYVGPSDQALAFQDALLGS